VEVFMRIRSPGLLLAGVLLVQGCGGSSAPVKNIDGLSPEARRAVLELPVYNEGDLNGKEHAVIAGVEGTACRYRRWDPAATEIDAINEAKYWAKDQGAEGIKNLKCDPPRGKTIFQTCWESITCKGQAIKFAR
jgi:hypothetical protein